MLVFAQTGLINKILEAVGISDFKIQGYQTKFTPLEIDFNGPHCKEQWHYSSVICMLMYLSSN